MQEAENGLFDEESRRCRDLFLKADSGDFWSSEQTFTFHEKILQIDVHLTLPAPHFVFLDGLITFTIILVTPFF